MVEARGNHLRGGRIVNELIKINRDYRNKIGCYFHNILQLQSEQHVSGCITIVIISYFNRTRKTSQRSNFRYLLRPATAASRENLLRQTVT